MFSKIYLSETIMRYKIFKLEIVLDSFYSCYNKLWKNEYKKFLKFVDFNTDVMTY